MIWFGSNLFAWVFTIGGPPPVLSYIGLYALGTAIIIFRMLNPYMRVNIRRDRFTIFLVWTLIWLSMQPIAFFSSSQSEIALQSLITNVELTLFLFFFSILLVSFTEENLLATLIFLLLAASIAVILDFMLTWATSVRGRGAGFYVNPTTAGCVLTLLSGRILISEKLDRAWKLPLALIGGVAIFLSFSRASWLIYFLLVGYIGSTFSSLKVKTLIGAFSALLLLLFLLPANYGDEVYAFIVNSSFSEYLTQNTLSRLFGYHEIMDESSYARGAAAKLTFDVFLSSNFIFGAGLAATRETGFYSASHNMYLYILAEFGLLGLSLYLCFLFFLFRQANKGGSLLVILLFAFGFFTHNILEDPSRVVFLACAVSTYLANTQRRLGFSAT